jgi:hypothetical protein
MIKSSRLRWARHVAKIAEVMSVFKILTSIPTGKRKLERPWRRWEDNIKMDFKEIGVNTNSILIYKLLLLHPYTRIHLKS